MSDENWLQWPDDDEDYDDGTADFLSAHPTFDDENLREILEFYGTDILSEVVINFDQVKNVEELRGNRFASVADAIIFLHNIGVLSFSKVVVYDDFFYGVAIPDNTPIIPLQ